jgi:hypothetical protein
MGDGLDWFDLEDCVVNPMSAAVKSVRQPVRA